MAFFDDLSKKISQAGQDVAQSTKNFAAVSKLNSLVSDEEKRINTLFFQIGKAYFEANRDYPQEGLADYVNAVAEALGRIEQYKEQIKEIKGITNCPECGADVPYAAAFCSICGAKMPQYQSGGSIGGDYIKCDSCGGMIPSGNKFCTICGNVIGSSSASEAANVQSVPSVCPNCGEPINSGSMFCTNCGAQL